MCNHASYCLTSALVLLAGCQKNEEPPPVRPVLSTVVKMDERVSIGFAGRIEPRFTTDLGFQTAGQIIALEVEVGDAIVNNETLGKLDPTNLDAQVRSGEADLAAAKSQLKNAQAAELRIKALVAQKVSSQADLDAAQQEREAATANRVSAEAQLVKARQERSYATLVSSMEGVITQKAAQVGQTVSAGQKVFTVASTVIREAVVDLPESLIGALSPGNAFTVQLQADPSVMTTGKIREIAPQADQVTRLFRVRMTLDRVVDALRLGSTVTAFRTEDIKRPIIRLPREAVFEKDGLTKSLAGRRKSQSRQHH